MDMGLGIYTERKISDLTVCCVSYAIFYKHTLF